MVTETGKAALVSALASGSVGFHWYSLTAGPVFVVIKHLWTWHRQQTKLKRILRQTASLVADAAVVEEAKPESKPSY